MNEARQKDKQVRKTQMQKVRRHKAVAMKTIKEKPTYVLAYA